MKQSFATQDEKEAAEGTLALVSSAYGVETPWCSEPVSEPDPRTVFRHPHCCCRGGEHAEQTPLSARFSRWGRKESPMEVLHECCCGLDVHAKTMVACLIKRGRKELRTFS